MNGISPGWRDMRIRRPVHVGNAAAGQVQLDVYGEVLAAMYYGRTRGLPGSDTLWSLERGLLGHLKQIWREPDDGIWEVRSGRQQFVHSKVMAWVAVDRAIRSAEEFGHEAPLDEWREWRQQIHDEVCEKGFDTARNTFVQYYGGKNLRCRIADDCHCRLFAAGRSAG